jgi:teichuronic acid biosynthesis glycosyltransferase TuaG
MMISIITPLYNAEKFLPETIKSVLAQTYTSFEMIIIDDQSNDGSFAVANEFAKTDNRIKVLQSSKNQGTAHARNMGLDVAKGDYVVFLDSDDLLDPMFLEKQLDFIEKEKCVVATSGYRRMAGQSNTKYIPPRVISAKRILGGNPISCLSTIFNRKIEDSIRFDEDLKKDEDLLFWYKILKIHGPAKGNQCVLATYRILPNSKSRNKTKLIEWQWKIYREKLGFGIFKSLSYLFKWAIRGLIKYRNVR